MTEDQLILLRDKHTLWVRASRQGGEYDDYNRRMADALGDLLAEYSSSFEALTTRAEAAERERDGMLDTLKRITEMRIRINTFTAAQTAFEVAQSFARARLSAPSPEEPDHGG